MGRALPTFVDGEPVMSKRTPDTPTADNSADTLERLLEADGFSKWGYETFMARLYACVTELLEMNNGLDLLDSFAPTVIEDFSFVGAATATLRAHFMQYWIPAAFGAENPGLSMDVLPRAEAGRYRFYIMVDQECLESVLRAPTIDHLVDSTAHVRLVYAEWEPPEAKTKGESGSGSEHNDRDQVEDEDDWLVPLEGCTAEDVGWTNVQFDLVQLTGYLNIKFDWDW
ncbi:hypothetical protein BDW74DRAFT_185462 [Aspergillus multicolor]|uniref:uncharacterized protein n=1 Tax=Aspergillus multicolor TaxID=41759 RepID=UPI003CCE2ABE